MNYLAHFYLSGEDPHWRVGGLMGDFLRGPVPEALPPGVRAGVMLHRRIDAYTDAHPVVGRSRRRVRPALRRFAGIVVDMSYDHFLARDWESRTGEPLSIYADAIYRLLQAHREDFPEPMQRSVDHMIRNDLLQSYRELPGIARALRGIQGRLSRPNPLAQGIVDLECHYAELEADFQAFFPELVTRAGAMRQALAATHGGR